MRDSYFHWTTAAILSVLCLFLGAIIGWKATESRYERELSEAGIEFSID